MSQSGLTVADAAASAAEFTRDAARRVWGAQALMAFGIALIVLATWRPQGIFPPRRTRRALRAEAVVEELEGETVDV